MHLHEDKHITFTTYLVAFLWDTFAPRLSGVVMLLASDVVCVKSERGALGIVESIGNEDEAEAQDLDPNDVGVELFWPTKPMNHRTSVEIQGNLELVDRGFLAGDVVSKINGTVPTVGSVQVCSFVSG